MPGHAFRKVLPGQDLQIPAAAYNAFLDNLRAPATVGPRSRGLVKTPNQHLLPIKNLAGGDVERFGILAIDSVLIDPDDSLPEFQGRPGFTGITPGVIHSGRFVVAAEPIPEGKVGLCYASGVCITRVYIPASGDFEFCDVEAGSLENLTALNVGSAAILWHENVTDDVAWAIISLGAGPPAHHTVFPISVGVSTPSPGDETTQAAHTYDVIITSTGEQVLTAIDPTDVPHHYRRPAAGYLEPAQHGIAYWNSSRALTIISIDEVDGVEECE